MVDLHQFEVKHSDDGAKHDMELHCTRCGEHLCDVEHGDTLDILVGMARDHACARLLSPREQEDDDTYAGLTDKKCGECGELMRRVDDGFMCDRCGHHDEACRHYSDGKIPPYVTKCACRVCDPAHDCGCFSCQPLKVS